MRTWKDWALLITVLILLPPLGMFMAFEQYLYWKKSRNR